MAGNKEQILILCKTYPSPSGKHSETSCVAGIRPNGKFIRLYPIPFRLINPQQQFKKWQWVNVHYVKARKDHRPESHSVVIDAIECIGDPLPYDNNWEARREAIKDGLSFSDFEALENNRKINGDTLALLRPTKIKSLDIRKVKDPDWTKEELDKLLGYQKQAGLFNDEPKDIKLLRKLPFDFYYTYICEVDGKECEYTHKIVDWEAGALFWRCINDYGDDWEKPFRNKLETELPNKEIMFLMGTIHRFPDTWLIISLIYPPKKQPVPKTPDLFA